MPLTLQDLRYAVALAEHGHFGRAAAACGIAQSTLSTQIKGLEAQLGVTLFERRHKSVGVTAVGAEIVRRARHVLEEVDAIMSVGQVISGPLVGPFSLGIIPTLGPYLLPWLVPALKAAYPALRLALREDLTAPLVEALEVYRLDAALVALPVEDKRLEVLPLFDEPFWLAEPKGAKPGGPKPGGRRVVREAELRGQTLLMLTEGHCLRDQALAICGTAERDASTDFSATSLETVLQMVATGLGRTLLPAMARGKAQGVSTRPLEPGLGRRIGLVTRRRFPRMRDVQLLAALLRAHVPPGVTLVPADEAAIYPDDRSHSADRFPMQIAGRYCAIRPISEE